MANHRLAAPLRELLGQGLPGAQTLAGGDDDRCEPEGGGGRHGEPGR
jgi:hypothetical protein